MSQQVIHIAQLLTDQELNQIDAFLKTAQFSDGKLTASLAAKDVKANEQIESGSKELESIRTIISNALQQSPLFNIAALPKHTYPFLVSKYKEQQSYGWHVDSPVMQSQITIRTDLAMTVFLSDPEAYQGGELAISLNGQVLTFKPAKGDAILYPCQYLHCVNTVTSGERIAAVSWIQSNVKNAQQRQILFELNQVHAALYQQAPNAPATNLLLQSHSNLFRMWADV